MANALPGSVDDLHRLACREFGRLKRHPEMIVRFLRQQAFPLPASRVDH
jgi:hypothetical protein